MTRALILLCALTLNLALFERASAAQVCVWIVESIADEGEHKFDLNLSASAPTSVSVRFQGPSFTSGSMGGDMIQLSAGEAKVIDSDGFDVSAGDDLHFDVRLFARPLSLDDLDDPPKTPLATFVFDRKVSENEGRPPTALAAKQCKVLG